MDSQHMPAAKVTASALRAAGLDLTLSEWKVLTNRGVIAPCGVTQIRGLYDLVELAARYRNDPELLREHRALAAKYTPNNVAVHRNCTVEWVGDDARLHRAENAKVAVKADTATITLPDGSVFRQQLYAKGFRFDSAPARRQQQIAQEVQTVPARKRRRITQEGQRRQADTSHRAQQRPRADDDLSELEHRFRAAVNGRRFEVCCDDADAEPITHVEILAQIRRTFRVAQTAAVRAVQQLEAGARVVALDECTSIRERDATP